MRRSRRGAAFAGDAQDAAIVYSCEELEGVDLEPFAPSAWVHSEEEILPLAPAVFEVVGCKQEGVKVTVMIKQLDHANFSYVEPMQK